MAFVLLRVHVVVVVIIVWFVCLHLPLIIFLCVDYKLENVSQKHVFDCATLVNVDEQLLRSTGSRSPPVAGSEVFRMFQFSYSIAVLCMLRNVFVFILLNELNPGMLMNKSWKNVLWFLFRFIVVKCLSMYVMFFFHLLLFCVCLRKSFDYTFLLLIWC